MSFCSRLEKPFCRRFVILWNPLACSMESSEEKLGGFLLLLRRFTKPFHRFLIIFWDTPTLCIEKSENALAVWISPLGHHAAPSLCLAKPLIRVLIVFQDTHACGVKKSEGELTFGILQFRCLPDPFSSFTAQSHCFLIT